MIHGCEWSILKRPRKHPDLIDENGDECFGRCLPSEYRIAVRTKMKLGQEQDTVWHECHHAFVTGLAIEHPSEEEFVSYLTPISLRVLKENPELMRYLTHVDKPRAKRNLPDGELPVLQEPAEEHKNQVG